MLPPPPIHRPEVHPTRQSWAQSYLFSDVLQIPNHAKLTKDRKCQLWSSRPLGREPSGNQHIPVDLPAVSLHLTCDVALLLGSLSFCSWQLHRSPAPRHSWGLQMRKDVPIWRCSNSWRELGGRKREREWGVGRGGGGEGRIAGRKVEEGKEKRVFMA